MGKIDIKIAVEMRQEGYTLQQIGDRFGVSKARAGQKLENQNYTQLLIPRGRIAKLLGISSPTMAYKEKKVGDLHPIRKGNSLYLYHIEDIANLIEILTKRCSGCGIVIPRRFKWCSGCLTKHKREYNKEYARAHYKPKFKENKPRKVDEKEAETRKGFVGG